MTRVAPMTYHKNSAAPGARLERLERAKALHWAMRGRAPLVYKRNSFAARRRGGEQGANVDLHRGSTVSTVR
jgi:hypothetical protein